MESRIPSPVWRTLTGSSVSIRDAVAAACRLKIRGSVAAQIAAANTSAATMVRLPARSCARVNPTAAISRTDATPSIRSRKTEAIASRPRTFSCVMLKARTASPPTLAGRNVPTNVLTKKIRITSPRRGRSAGSMMHNSTTQR